MSHRFSRWVARVVWTLGTLAALGSWPGFATSAHADRTIIRFDELASFVSGRSPSARTLDTRVEMVEAERRTALQWSNPSVAYEHERVDGLNEWQLTVGKRIAAPLSWWERRAGWNGRVRAAELRRDHEFASLLAHLQTGYVRIQLLNRYLDYLDRLEDIVGEAAGVADARYREGEMSGVDRHLIQLTVLSLEAGRRDARRERNDAAARWRAEMGIAPGDSLRLATQISYRPVALDAAGNYVARLSDRPYAQSRAELSQSLDALAKAASPGLLPEIEVFAGVKRVDPEFDGIVGGVALSVPLFNRNAGAVKQLEARRRMVEAESAMENSRLALEVAALIDAVDGVRELLASVNLDPDSTPAIMEAAFQAYDSGHMTLNEFLSAVQIQVAGTRDYYRQLITYYESIFQLEAITGAEIVSFETEETQ